MSGVEITVNCDRQPFHAAYAKRGQAQGCMDGQFAFDTLKCVSGGLSSPHNEKPRELFATPFRLQAMHEPRKGASKTRGSNCEM
jgi:hypothetical protein